jgi:hypothetical protein
MPASLAGLVLLLAGGLAQAQQALPPLPPTPLPAVPQLPAVPDLGPPRTPGAAPGKTLTFHKAAAPASGLQPTLFQPGKPPTPAPPAGTTAAENYEFQIQLEPASAPRLFGHLESEEALRERIRQEFRNQVPPDRAVFPEEVEGPEEPFRRRVSPPIVARVEPNYVCYGRLFFEDRNSERYGWDLGWVQPFVSAGLFYADLVALPYHWGEAPCGCWDCSAGYCLPGDPVPYLFYPPGLSLLGAVSEAGAVLGLVAVFP